MITAVEWLMNDLIERKLVRSETPIKSFLNASLNQAKELEKQQIIEFTNDFIDKHTFGDYDGIVQKNKLVEEYYNEKFNK